jgi:micrococcal nuclease
MACTSAITGLCALLFTQSALAIEGYPSAYDGDTLYFASQSVRLYGIDAEEMDEKNGRAARDGLRFLIRTSGAIRCHPVGPPSHGRIVANFFMSNSRSINAEMVAMGLALDCPRYSNGVFAHLEPKGVRDRLKQKPYCVRKSVNS